MNRLYVTSRDGRVFFADSHSDTFELLDSDSPCQLRFKRLASCTWSLWAVSATFRLHLCAHELDTPFEHQATTYENQRRYNLLSATSFTDKLFFSDRPKFSCRDGLVELPKADFHAAVFVLVIG